MVDFNKLKKRKKKQKPFEPTEIFRRLPKPPGINDLYTSQAEVLHQWYKDRNQRDTVVKLHTGGGKTLVGLLMAQSTLNETGEPVLYLTPTVQLVNQTVEKATELGIYAVPYERGQPLNDDFINGSAIMVGTYKSLFHGQSKFGLRGDSRPQSVSAIILDDAHAAFSVVRDSFTLDIKSDNNRDRYEALAGLFRKAFRDIDKLGTFDDILSGYEYSVLEIPYYAWHEKLDSVREQLKAEAGNYPFEWPLLRDQLHLCHALISRKAFTLTPILPLVDSFPTFFDAPRRIYMSATIADDSEIIRTFDATPKSVQNALVSRSLAGISERLIFIPDLMPFSFDIQYAIERLVQWTADQNLGAVILVPSDKVANKWSKKATVALGSAQVEKFVEKLQERKTSGPIVFSNRYDGIDLPGDSCRLLIMSGLPSGTSSYELFRASALYGGVSIIRLLAQRIEQGIGRGARGAGDHCVVLLVGSDIAGWVSKNANFQFFTSATKAQLEMGSEISGEVSSLKDLAQTIKRCFDRDKDWVEYHAETLAELVDEETVDQSRFKQATVERKALNLWHDGYHEKAVNKIQQALDNIDTIDPQSKGWMEQLAARIANAWGHKELAETFQQHAYAHNRNLLRPKIIPPYRTLSAPKAQTKAIINQLTGYHFRRGFLQSFEETCSRLHHNASSNQFEQALADFAKMIGLSSERFDINGEGPDVLWLLPGKIGLVIEAKSRKKEKKALTKEEHGQLLVASEWFAKQYTDYQCIRVSVHPKNKATKAAVAGASYALTYDNLNLLISDARNLLNSLCESHLSPADLIEECNQLLNDSTIKHDKIVGNYLLPFED